MIVFNVFKHLCLVSRHKWEVFKLCLHAGIPMRGLVHDLSKFSPSEFWESVKYYNGSRSPLEVSREKNGYSLAWLHHKGRNKHHWEYWIDISKNGPKGCIIPRKYATEMVCDMIAASKVYKGKAFTYDSPLAYFAGKPVGNLIHPYIQDFMMTAFTAYAKEGPAAITGKRFKAYYKKCVQQKEASLK